MLQGKSVLITGGTGSFGHAFVPMTLSRFNLRRLIIFSRDEMKQWEMAKRYGQDDRVRFFIGDVRDKDRLTRALDGIDYVVHAAATKIVPTAEYNPFECIKTNILGAMNLIDACIDCGVKRVVALSTDKASSPTALPSWLRTSSSSPGTRMPASTIPHSRWFVMEMSWARAAR
jgi:FlaA1/EpsC-like NDP-sugar epimerase